MRYCNECLKQIDRPRDDRPHDFLRWTAGDEANCAIAKAAEVDIYRCRWCQGWLWRDLKSAPKPQIWREASTL
jgi:hypothetical protein